MKRNAKREKTMEKNTIELNLDQFEGLNIKSAEDLVALVAKAAETKSATFDAEAFKTELLSELKGVTGQVNELSKSIIDKFESEALADLESAGLRKAYDNETDLTKKAELVQKARETHGNLVTGLALSGNEFKKAMIGPVTKENENYGVIKNLREIHDMALMLTTMKGGLERVRLKEDLARVNRDILNESLELLEKAGYTDVDTYRKAAGDTWDTATSGDGSEWLPVNMSRDMIDAIFLPLEVAPLFRRINMTSKSFRLPRVTGRSRAAIMAEGTSNSTLYTTAAAVSMQDSADITFAARKLGVTQGYSDEIEQDAIVPTAQMVLESIVDGIGASIEDAVLNGSRDTFNDLDNASGGNELWATTAAALGRDAWDGLRVNQAAGVKVNTSGVLTTASLRSARKKMGRYGKDPAKLVWIISVNSLMDVLGLAEVITLDKYGPAATILQGEIGRVDNIRIVVSEFVYTNLNASGVYDNSVTTKTAMYLVYLPAWAFGDRRLMRVEQDRVIVSQQNVAVGSWRGDFQKLLGSETTEAQLYNLVS